MRHIKEIFSHKDLSFIDDEYASDSTIRVIDESGKNERAAVKSLVGGTF